MKRCKIYKDGEHFIAMRPTTGRCGPRRKQPPEELIEVTEPAPSSPAEPFESKDSVFSADTDEAIPDTVKNTELSKKIETVKTETVSMQKETKRISTRYDEFMRWYRESVGMRRKKRRKFIADQLRPYFPNGEELYKYVDRKIDCRIRADITRRIRCLRRASLHELSYFCTVT